MKYRKKPVVIEAIQATEEQIWKWILKEEPYPKNTRLSQASYHEGDRRLSFFKGTIETLEGDMQFGIDDWIITGVKGECYPCKPDIFEQTYDKVDIEPKQPRVLSIEELRRENEELKAELDSKEKEITLLYDKHRLDKHNLELECIKLQAELARIRGISVEDIQK